MKYPILLPAKSAKSGITLQQHSLDTETAAILLFKKDSRFLNNWLMFFGIKDGQDKFLLNLRVACLFHDVGKANEDFIKAVSGQADRNEPQTLRHEHISGAILLKDDVREWLKNNPNLDVDIITAAVLSHHIKVTDQRTEANCEKGWFFLHPRTSRTKLTMFFNHKEVKDILTKIKTVADLGSFQMDEETEWDVREKFQSCFRSVRQKSAIFDHSLRENPHNKQFLTAVKTGLIICDSISSALIREELGIKEWIQEVIHSSEIEADEVDKKIIRPLIVQKEKQSAKKFVFHSFQTKIQNKGRRAMLLAACGTGKTLAAYKWAEAVCKKEKRGKIIFLYPTRGTATEGFKDYISWAPETDASLLHSSSKYEIQKMAENPKEGDLRNYREFLNETEERLFSLSLWRKKFFSATVDQFLSFIEHNYKSICLLPALVDSVLIIDEVHSFDKQMFNALTVFLEKFDIPVLCMTATLPPTRKKQLLELGLSEYPNEEDRSEMQDLAEKEIYPRYQIKTLSDEAEGFKLVMKAIKANQKVLWVANTVKLCQRIFQGLQIKLTESQNSDCQIFCYHSRFRLMDRQERHQDVIDNFKKPGAQISVTTQVCEMSLDLDADLLITQLAPIPSLVQRFGRVNRHLTKGADFRGKIYIYDSNAAKPYLPYTKEEIECARKFISDLPADDISQEILAKKLDEHVAREPLASGISRLFSQGYFATPGEFRDLDDFSDTCVLDSDVTEVQDRLKSLGPIDGYLISVPRKEALPSDQKPEAFPAWLQVADGKKYNSQVGYMYG